MAAFVGHLVLTGQGAPPGDGLTHAESRPGAERGEVLDVTARGDTPTGTYRPAESGERRFHTERPSFAGDDLRPLLDRSGVELRAGPDESRAPP